MNFTVREVALCARINEHVELGYSEKLTIEDVERESDREFDLSIRGKGVYTKDKEPLGHAHEFSGWLPLSTIHCLTCWPKMVPESDHPTMDGDWSAIRDSDPETIWAMLDRKSVV